MLGRLYFLHGGKRVWFSSWLLTASLPVILLPITINYYMQRRNSTPSSPIKTKLFSIKPPIFLAAAVIGDLTGLDDYLYAYGVARLPVSTSSLIIASQLAFTAGCAFLLVKQKFTSYSINAAIGREAKEYEFGEAKFYVVVVANSLTWQCFCMGSIGVIFCASSLLSGILIAVLLPITEILAVIFYNEKFQAEKGFSLALSI
ncbi:hypothetical protein Dsin_002872 [Dipteronia sinensis]|uniref:Purine permease n=1 Tax=Dipteronia sinensis TaxID=43782 RepID=A0AAE0EJU0_9ROSI|nr:hypothetical protein Dsin_002872 [Dipteronia sinensis]